MEIYYLMYIAVSWFALLSGINSKGSMITWYIFGFFLVIIIGLRHVVGGDWFAYLYHFNNIHFLSLKEIMISGDPAHKFINWSVFNGGGGIYVINLIYTMIFVYGLIRFSRQQVYPWLSMAVAIPYLVIVVAMGYSRQAVSIGLFLIAITYLRDGKFIMYVLLVLVATLFHKTAIILLPLGTLSYNKGGWLLRVSVIAPVLFGFYSLYSVQHDLLWKNYVEAEMISEGAKIRVLMNLIPSLILLLFRKTWKSNFNDYYFWLFIAICSIICVFFVGYASTAIDRISLYFILIQLVVYSRLPFLMQKQIPSQVTRICILVMYLMVLFIWLNFATHSQYWLPYQNIIFIYT